MARQKEFDRLVRRGMLSTAGGCSIPRWATPSDLTLLTTGTVRVVPVWLTQGTVVSNIKFCAGASEAHGPTHQQFGLYELRGTTWVLVASSADNTNTAWATTVIKTLAVTTPYKVPRTGIYLVALVVAVAGGGEHTPTLYGMTVAHANLMAGVPNGNTADTPVTALPATLGAITAAVGVPWCEVT